ncbi:helix-turn-helix domain-containing protein [Clostridium estertheticum]|uniref:Crp/Fnr family transcriptional regulator n=1 Tax=Clostridium estertheticum TaxID=238834 RepID=UPI001C0DC6E7|nr:helix-turn-helix domain-containing protein [Clostridium estertheticum]MBU3177873.1 helix-turn-helix domain-containing protein [Clostridium estertheticum]
MINKLFSSKLFKNIRLTKKTIDYLKDYIISCEIRGEKQFLYNELLENKIILILDGSFSLNLILSSGSKTPLKIYTKKDVIIKNELSSINYNSIFICTKKVKYISIREDAIRELLPNDPSLLYNYLNIKEELICHLLNKIELSQEKNNLVKICKYILFETSNLCNNTISLLYTMETLSDVLGMSNSTLYRKLNYLKRHGIISLNNKTIKVLDMDELQALMTAI